MGVRILECFQCGYTWVTGRLIDQCPKCKSLDWNKPKKNIATR